MKRIHKLILLVLTMVVVAVPVLAQDANQTPAASFELTAAGFSVPETVPAGIVTVRFDNQTDAPSGLTLARLNEGVTVDQVIEAMGQEDPMAALALVSLLTSPMVNPNDSEDVTYDLQPGTYLALSFAGEQPDMKTFTVAGEAQDDAQPTADVEVRLMDFAFTLPTEIAAGPHTWLLSNQGGQWHEMAIAKLDDDMTVSEYRDLLKQIAQSAGPESMPIEPTVMWGPMAQGERAWVTVDLEPGTYVVACFLPDLMGSGHAHADLGMAQIITVN